jgi:LPS O-antigen subunit length determinant protein (WzzB/FepE family)
MSYRYNTIDIIVGVGMCAIVFGALLFFFAANGTYQTAIPQPISSEQPVGIELGTTLLQAALGQAIVDQAVFERRANQVMAQSASEWNRATLAYHEWQSLPGGPFGAVMRQAATVPADHMARVQAVMGRAIVNFTARGIRSGVLSADQYLSNYNTNMIRATEASGQRLDQEFASTWQATLGRRIVDASRDYRWQAGAIQEQLGSAILHVTQAQTGPEEVRAAQQEQLASLVVAAIRTEALADRLTLLAAIESSPEDTAVASTEPVSWPEIPLGYLIVAGLMLVTVFFGGLSLTAQTRETKALAEMKHHAARWVYRMAA